MIVFDLDPGPPANIVQCAQVAMWLRKIFEHFGLQSFPKNSGSKGLQIYVPLNTSTTYEETKPFAHALARLLEEEHPELVVSDMKKAIRTGKVLVDWSQNDEHKTTVSVYSLRARERPTVSTPLQWEEVEKLLKKKDPDLLVFEAPQVLERADKFGDLFEPALKLKQKLPKLGDLLASGELEGREREVIATQASERAQQMARKAERRGPPPVEAGESTKRKAPKHVSGKRAANVTGNRRGAR
jgi:bifunctional non-homologous end joining protein LigD